MAHFRGGDRPFSSIHKVLKMLLSPHSSTKPASQDTTTDMAEDVDEPPDNRFFPSAPIHSDDDNAVVYVKSPAAATASHEQKESLLTRALRSKKDFSPSEPHSSAYDHSFSYRSYPHSNVSGVSTAELTSDGGMTTSPSLSNTPSPPAASHLSSRPAPMAVSNKDGAGPGESSVEANLGRKRCISFACGRKTEDQQKPPSQQTSQTSSPKYADKDTTAPPAPAEPVKRKTMLTFACPGRDSKEPLRERSPAQKAALRSRPRGSPAPLARKASPPENKSSAPTSIPQAEELKTPAKSERIGVPTKGLGKFEESEETRFHEFASSVEEDDEWVKKTAEYPEKITMNDCMKKELAIRKLGEEAENEALEDEDEEDDDEDDDDDDDDDDSEDDDDDDDLSTLHDSDDGNESDNEAGFAESDESDGGSDYEFWAPTSTPNASSSQPVEISSRAFEVGSYNSYETHLDDGQLNAPPTPSEKYSSQSRRSSKAMRMRPVTPHLPDSTDFVCGTLDEDRPLEVAYKSCMEQRRLSKQVVIPQDIDPSFPTSDPEDEDDDDDEEDEVDESVTEEGRGRTGSIQVRRPSPRPSPPKQRMVSPPPPRAGRSSPKRLRSPPPPAMKMKSTPAVKQEDSDETPAMHPHGLNISGLVQRPSLVMRTKSLPRTPNPFFANLDRLPRWSGNHISDLSDREHSRTREAHNRGPIDIVEGLEKKRQKRKEKFWRQHCRKAAKEQMERRPIPGRGAERMKELGLEAAERCRAYGVGEDAQLVLSV